MEPQHVTQVLHLPTRTEVVEFNVPLIQYASGRIEARTPGQQRFIGHVGFFSEANLDADFDDAMREVGFQQIEIRHTREGQDATVRVHWDLGEKIGLWPLSAGPVATSASVSSYPPYAERTANAGIGLRWETQPNGTPKSKLALRGYLYQLVSVGYNFPIQLSVRSRMSDKLLAALQDHLAVVEEADDLVNKHELLATDVDAQTLEQLHRQGQAKTFAFYDLLLPLRVGPEESFGRTVKSNVSPLVSGHPESLTPGYIKKVWRPRAVFEAVGRDWSVTVAWAIRTPRPTLEELIAHLSKRKDTWMHAPPHDHCDRGAVFFVLPCRSEYGCLVQDQRLEEIVGDRIVLFSIDADGADTRLDECLEVETITSFKVW